MLVSHYGYILETNDLEWQYTWFWMNEVIVIILASTGVKWGLSSLQVFCHPFKYINIE